MSWFIGLTGFALGMISCAVLAIVEYGAWALVLPPRSTREPQGTTDVSGETNADDTHGDQGVSLSVVAADGVKLAGSWYPAAGLEPTGRTVILLHGFAEPPGNVQAMRVAALNEHGWNAAVIDLRGYGRSEGPFASFGGRESGDVRAWLGALADRPGPALAPQRCLGPLDGRGHCFAPSAEGPVVKALVLESPMVDLDEAVGVWLRKAPITVSASARAADHPPCRTVGRRLLDPAPRTRTGTAGVLSGPDHSWQ